MKDWADVDPDRLTFDREAARLAVRRALATPFESPYDGLVAIDRALAASAGAWTYGWRWSASEGSPGGGPVPASIWCCPHHSLFPDGWRVEAIEPQTEQVLAAVDAWREALVRAKALFARLGPMVREDPERMDLVLGEIIDQALADSDGEDAWYSWASELLGWFFETLGARPDAARALAERMVDGRFESWVEPSPDVRAAACGSVHEDIQALLRTP